MVCKWCKNEEITNLALHNRWYHWECTRCKKLFEDNDKYHEHCRVVHSKIYCDRCYRMYKNRNDLKMVRRSFLHSNP
jgi:NAD-dependent SIR2 family protein deacetylase